jgi:cytoskeletal protein CcmA (bactofilin family)
MFQGKTKPGKEIPAGSTSIIGKGVTLTGDIDSTADIRIDGTLHGNIKSSARVFIGADAMVEGNIESNHADILGKVKGIVRVKEVLNLRGKACLVGDIYTTKLEVEPTANFNGQCHMNGSVIVEMVHQKNEQQKAHAK